MIKKISILLVILLTCAYSYAGEVITGFDDKKDLPVLNNELRKKADEIRNAQTDITTLQTDVAAIENKVVQVVYSADGGANNTTTTIPYDNSAPLATEGKKFMSKAITKQLADTIIKIDVVINLANSATAQDISFVTQDSGNSIGTAVSDPRTANSPICISYTVWVTGLAAGTYTYNVFGGANVSGTCWFNGNNALGTGVFNGTCASSITIWELKP